MNIINKPAFTLAETLITLGIIGIVAVLTLPGILVKRQKNISATRLKQTYSQLYQAFKTAESEYGEMDNWGDVSGQEYTTQLREEYTTNFADTYILPYLKTIGKTKFTTLAEQGYQGGGFNSRSGELYGTPSTYYIANLVNGATLFFATDDYYGADGKRHLTNFLIFVDINGLASPNRIGQDVFLFVLDNVNSMTLKAYGQSNNIDTLKINCGGMNSVHNLQCTALVMKSNWEIGDAYPWD